MDQLAEAWSSGAFPAWREKFSGQLLEVKNNSGDGDKKLLLLKPQTYMNKSGVSVSQAARFYKIPGEKIIVFYDELDLVPGKLRHKSGGGSAGHNGIRSICSHIGHEFHRIRLGIGHPGHKDRVLGHVLGDFSHKDQLWLEPFLDAIIAAKNFLRDEEFSRFQTEVMRLVQTNSE